MKKTLLLGIMMISSVANAEVIEFMGRRMEIGENGMKITDRITGQVWGMENGKNYLNTGNNEVGTISSEFINKDTFRFGIGGTHMDMKADPNDPNTVLFLGPDGKVVRKMIKTIDANGNEVVQVKDATGKIISQVTKGVNGKGASGSINEMFPNGQTLNMQIEDGEVVGGRAKFTGRKYKQDMRINRGNIEIIVKDAISNKVICKVQANDNYSRVFDGNGKLIAEGADEDNPKIYNKKVFDECQYAIEDDDD